MSFSFGAVGTKAGVRANISAMTVQDGLGTIAQDAILDAIDAMPCNGVEVTASGHLDRAYGNVTITVTGKNLILDPEDD